jgi:hypothetical protein
VANVVFLVQRLVWVACWLWPQYKLHKLRGAFFDLLLKQRMILQYINLTASLLLSEDPLPLYKSRNAALLKKMQLHAVCLNLYVTGFIVKIRRFNTQRCNLQESPSYYPKPEKPLSQTCINSPFSTVHANRCFHRVGYRTCRNGLHGCFKPLHR